MGDVYDFSFERPSAQRLVDVGALGAIGYVSRDPRKNLDRSYVDELIGRGLKVAVVHENTASWETWDGAGANRQCDALGMPDDRPLYYAADTDVSPDQYARIGAKLLAQPGRPKGIYGESGLVEFCLENGLAQVGWLTSASSWSHDPAPKAALRQLVGHTTISGTDKNVVLADDWGQWPLDHHAPSPGGTVAQLTLVMPPNVYEPYLLDGKTKHPKAGQPHPHAGQVFIVEGLTATHVSSPSMIDVYRYIGAVDSTGHVEPIHSEWFGNLSILPTEFG